MRCENCGVPLEEGSFQCSVCGEILKSSGKKSRTDFGMKDLAEDKFNRVSEVDPIDTMFSKKRFLYPSIVWIVLCFLLAMGFTVAAVYDSSPEFMYAAFIVGTLAFFPLLFLITGRVLQLAVYTRKGLTVVFLGLVLVAVFYLISLGIQRSNMTINATGAMDLLKDPFFGKIAVTIVVCITILAALVPITRLIAGGLKGNSFLNHYKAESERMTGENRYDNDSRIRMRELEQQYELELKKLQIEEQRLQLENKLKRDQLEYKNKSQISDEGEN